MVSDKIIYCSDRKCLNNECLRNYRNMPWNEVVLRQKFDKNKSGVCEGYLK